jgi:hypothetical protein
MIEDIERLDTELQLLSFSYLRIFQQGHVGVEDTRSTKEPTHNPRN